MVHLHNRHGLSAGFIAASQSKIGDIDIVAAKQGAYFAHHAGYIQIAEINELTLQGHFNLNTVHAQQAQGGPAQHTAPYPVLVRGGFEHDGKYVRNGAGWRFLPVFMDLDPAFLGDGSGVDYIGAFRDALVQYPLNGGVSYQLRLPFAETSGVADRDFLH